MSRLIILLAVLLSLPVAARAEEEITPAERHFATTVYPILQAKCFACHGEGDGEPEGELDLTSREGMLDGGESGEPSIVPGDPEEGLLVGAIEWDLLEMPPKENDRLSEEQIAAVRKWITEDAVWPDAERRATILKAEREQRVTAEGMLIDTSGGLSDEWTYRRYDPESVWAFRPVSDVQPPSKGHPVDAFVDAKLSAAKLTSAPEATPRELIRRATYDLTGLPPTLDEVTEFEAEYAEDSESAWAALIERLLASPRYGERWAQHWLDVVRYADTSGFSNDYERSNAWRYRDYVIRSLNNDKPYDEFVIEQLAGDEQKPNDPEATLATGYLRMGPWGTAMIPKDEARQLYLDDLVHSVGQTFMSLPLRCCRCHDHKFDPIPTRDYYRIYAAFAGTQPAEVSAKFIDAEYRKNFEEDRKITQELLAFAKAEVKQLVDKREAAAKQWFKEHDLPYKDYGARSGDPVDKKPPRHVGLTEEEGGILKVREQDVWIWERRLERYQPLAQGVYNGPVPKWLNSRKLRPAGKTDPKWTPETYIHQGGDRTAQGPPVGPGVLSGTGLTLQEISVTDEQTDPYRIPDDINGRRLALAKWIASPANPLTTRSIVNRVWQHHFGRGIVKTANNFGVKGDRPTHPELLDWLANDFTSHDWSLKHLHRRIMTSDAYRRSTRHPDPQQVATADPNGLLLAAFRPRRLSAEELRDTLLTLSGELNLTAGGLPIRPEINREVAFDPRMIQFSIAPAWQSSRTPEERNRRSIYAYKVRGQADPFMEVLGTPSPNESCEMRETAAVTPQAFTLLNSETMMKRSLAFALRLTKEAKTAPEQVARAFRLAFGRDASEEELSRLLAYRERMEAHHRNHTPKTEPFPTEIVRSLVEEQTGKPFEFIEKLPTYRDYVSDTLPEEVSPDVRALADVCLVLMNANELMYVY